MVHRKGKSRMPKPYQSIRIFKSDFCEFFTHVHPITPLLVWVPIVLFLFYRAFALGLSAWAAGSWAVIGWLIWTLMEYVLHRFILHFPAQSDAGERFCFIIHGLLHQDANDPTRLVMPPFASVCIAIICYTIFRALLGGLYVAPFFAGFLIGYLCYDYIHYGVHHFTPRTKMGRVLKQNHMNHHYVRPNSRWGVSSPLWDFVFGTLDEPEQVRHES